MVPAETQPHPDGGHPLTWRFPACVMLAAAALLSLYLSPREFWIDATGYVAAVAKGEKVVQPPGYVGFIGLARLLEPLLGSPYRALQLISAVCYLASIPFVCFALRLHTSAAAARALTLAYAFGWVCLNIATVGTSHASDLLFGGILVYLAALPRPDRSSRGWHPALFLTVVGAVSFRTSTVVMALPFLVLVMLRDWRLPRFWISALVAAALAGAIVAITARCYGGWDTYREISAALHANNSKAGLLTGGGWKTGGMNLFRAGFWLFLAVPLLPLLALAKGRRRDNAFSPDWPLLLPAALAGGVLFVIFGYLCVHPGYLAAALPPLLVLLARVLRPSPALLKVAAAQVLAALLLFFIPGPVQPPASARDAAANAFLLQFTARAHRQPVTTLSLSSWLFLAGRSDLIPPHRRAKAESDLRPRTD